MFETIKAEIIYKKLYLENTSEEELLDAMEEAKRISRDPKTKRYDSFSDALEDID